METPDASAEVSFDKASFSSKKEVAVPCSNCHGSLGEQYWHWQGKAVCEKCNGLLTGTLAASQSKKAFARAALLGGAAALGCGIIYAIFVQVTGYQLAIITIGIAFVIAKIMRRCSHGVGGVKFQILAVALTYLASTMGYAPAVFSAISDNGRQEDTAQASASAKQQPAQHMSVGGFATGIAVIFGFIMAAPFLAASDAPIGLLIVGFALWEAWKLSRGLPLVVDGPYRATPATGPPAE